MIKFVSAIVVVSLGVIASSRAVGQTLPAGPAECRVISITSNGWNSLIDVVVHSSITDPTVANGLVRQAGAQAPLDGPKNVPPGKFPNEDYEFKLGPPQGGWAADVIYMFEFYVEKNGNWYRTIVAFRFVGQANIEIWDIYENSGIID